MVSALRTKRFFSQRTIYEVSMETGILPSRISLVERDLVAARPDEQEKLAKYFGCSVDELFNHSGRMIALQSAC